MVKSTVEYSGDLHCLATHGPSGKTIDTDAPLDNQGRGEAFSPTDLVAAALGTCMATIMGIYARKHGIDLQGMKIEVAKEMSAESPRRIRRIATEVWLPVSKDIDPNGNLEKAALACPVHQSLHPAMEKPVTFHWRDPSLPPEISQTPAGQSAARIAVDF